MQAPTSLTVTGFSQETTYAQTRPNTDIAGVTFTPPSAILDATSVMNFDAPKDISAIQFTNANRTLSFDTAKKDTIAFSTHTTGMLVININSPIMAAAGNPYQAGWNYQSFGVWAEDTDYTIPNVTIKGDSGGLSIGSPTAGGSIPTSGGGSFTGLISAVESSDLGRTELMTGTLTVTVDFGARTAALVSSDMAAEGGVLQAHDMVSGTLSYAAGQNALTGTLTTKFNGLSGPATAKFYGPAAQEIGGVFALTAPDSSNNQDNTPVRFVGAFGAARGP